MLGEVISRKDFSLLFSYNFREFLDGLKNIPETHFSSKVHYEYYRKFFVPLLSHKDRKLELYISQSYIYVIVRKNRQIRTFLLGFNDDSKLFINELELPMMTLKFRWGALKFSIEDTELYEAEDEEILNLLRIKGQSEGYAVVSREGRYRVQGEVVLNVVEVIDSMDEMLRRMMLREVEEYVMNFVHERIAFALTNIGFNVGLAPFTRAPFVRGGARGLKLKDRATAIHNLAKILVKELEKLLNVEVIDYDVQQVPSERYDLAVELRMTTRDGDVIIAISLLEDDVIIQAEVAGLLKKLREKLLSELVEQVKASKRDFEFYVSNHRVTLKNCLSPSFALKPSLKMMNFLFTSEIRVQAFGYIFDKDSEILLQHREHGTSVVKFAKSAIARIDVIDVPIDYLINVNRVVFSMLAKS